MSLELGLVSQVMYLREGEVNSGNEAKVARFESKMLDWKRDVITGSKNVLKEEMSADLYYQVENSFNGYWCEGVKCC
jgi:hypothetical protein